MSTTVMLRNISTKINNDTIINFFADIGTVRTIKFVMANGGDNLRAYVKFKHRSESREALKMSGMKLLGKRVEISYSDSNENNEKGEYYNIDESSDEISDVTTILISHLRRNTDYGDIIKFLGDVGQPEKVRRCHDPRTRKFIGYYVRFKTSDEAKHAISKNGEKLNGRKVYIEFI